MGRRRPKPRTAVAVQPAPPQRPLTIVQIGTADHGGGAAAVASGLMKGSERRGHRVWHLVGRKHTGNPNVRLLPDDDRWLFRAGGYLAAQTLLKHLGARWPNRGLGLAGRTLRLLTHPRALRAKLDGAEDFEFPASAGLLDQLPAVPDVVHGHNLQGGYFDLRALASISARVPTVLTLHDMWLLTGHCAHSLGCERWTIGCGACPDLALDPPIRRDATAANWQRKRDIIERSRLHIVTPSAWLRDKVEASMLGRHAMSVRVIPNGVDTGVFRPADRVAVRRQLGLPVSEPIVLLTTGSLGSMWKDDRTLREAMEHVAAQPATRDVRFIAVGRDSAVAVRGRAITQAIPYQHDPQMMAKYYQAADVYLHAARADTAPLAILEAMACGTPVVATDVGGIPEQINGVTGVLVPRGAGAEMSRAVIGLLTDRERRQVLASLALKAVRASFTLERQVDAYIDTYYEVAGPCGHGSKRC